MQAIVVLPPAKTSHELDLARAMPAWGVTVVTGHGFGPDDADHSLPTRRLPYLGGPNRWTAALAWHRGLAEVDCGIADVVMSVELHSPVSVQAGRLARALGVPHVVVIWETLADNPLYALPPWRWFLRSLTRSADTFICFTERARQHALALGCAATRTAVVHPGVDTELYHPRAEGLIAEPVMLFVGEIRADKGVLDIIAATDVVHARRPDLRLVLVGDGPLAAKVEQLAAARPFLDYRGPVPRASIPALMREARALVVAPVHRRFWEEQFGFAYVEAMASGLPVVTTNSGAIPEIVPAVNSLVPEGDVPALAVSIEQMMGECAIAIGRTNRETALDRYDLRRQGARLGQVLTEVVGGVSLHE
jgi:phosphatidylinositol alpha-1,6-mannosyltransferase